jgi:actin-related protein 5
MAAEVETSNTFYVPTSNLPSTTLPDSYDPFRSQSTPLIIDNGSSNLRFGFSTSASPHTSPNVIAKYKERKFNQSLLLFGDAIDAESGAKSQAKTPWEADVLLNFDAMVGSCLPVDEYGGAEDDWGRKTRWTTRL